MRSSKNLGLAQCTIASWRRTTTENFFVGIRAENILLGIETLLKNGENPEKWALSAQDKKLYTHIINGTSERDKPHWKFMLENNIDMNELERVIKGEK